MDYDELTEELTDFFARQHHGTDVARSRALSVVEIVKRRVAVEAANDRPVYGCPGADLPENRAQAVETMVCCITRAPSARSS